jgi:CheY-like chemotaxis protein
MTDITLSITEDASVSDLCLSWILLDPNRFLQVVINLITNSIKFTRTAKRRHIDITVAAYLEPPADHMLGVQFVPRRYESAKPPSPTDETSEGFQVWEDVYLSFSVKDSGKGLTKDEMARLFNRFTQASPKTHVEYGGSGLGLFISRQITEMLGGEIGMSSKGVGSTFAFYAKASKVSPPRRPSVSIEPILQLTRSLSLTSTASPLVVPPDEKNGAAIDVKLIPPESPPRSNSLERHILVVEDNLVNQKVLCKLLRNRNFVVDAANHGREALDAIKKLGSTRLGRVYDAILCDIEMPVMGGIEFAKQVRSQEASREMLGHVPIIGVTANVRRQQVSAAIEAGMVSFSKARVAGSVANTVVGRGDHQAISH